MRVHAGPLLAVPVGGDHWGSIGTTLLCLVAVGVLIRKGRYRLLVLCSAPFALNLIAAAMRRFPYGGHMRLAMHLAPLVSILAAIGATAVFKWFSPGKAFPPRGSLIGPVGMAVRVHAGPLLAVPVGGSRCGSIGTTLFCLVALGWLIHKGRYRLLVLARPRSS